MKTRLLILALQLLLILSIFPLTAEETLDLTDLGGTINPTTTQENIDKKIQEGQEVPVTNELSLEQGTATANNIRIQRDSTTDGLNKITFLDKGTITINGYIYSNLKPVNNKPPEIYLDREGKIQKASFTTDSESTTIVLGNEILEKLPAGTQVIYENKKATIIYPKNKDIKLPKETIDNKLGESTFYFQYKDSNQFNLPNGDKIYTTQLGSKNGNLFFDTTEARIGDDIEIKNPNKIKTYLDFTGKPNLDFEEAYLSINRNEKKLTFGMNIKGEGPSLLIKPNSDFAPDKKGENDHLVIQPYSVNGEKSFVYIRNRQASKKVTRAVSLNGVRFNNDGRSPYYNAEKEKFLIRLKGNLVKEFKGSEGYVQLQVEAYKSKDNDYNNLINVFKDKDIMIIDNNGRTGVGPDPDFIPVKSLTYSKYKEPGLYKGVSQWLVYDELPTARTFERFTGVRINDQVGLPPERIKMLMDVFAGIPRSELKSVKNLNIVNYPTGWAGLAGPGEVNLHWSNGGVDPGTARHEITHVHDMRVGWSGGTSRFDRQWQSIGGQLGPHLWDYGYTQYEDTSTFGQYTYQSKNYWKGVLNENYKYHKKMRGRIAVFTWNGFMTRDEADRILSSVGLSADDQTLEKIYKDAQNSYRSIG